MPWGSRGVDTAGCAQIITFAAAHVIGPMAQVIEGSPEEHALQISAGRAATSRQPFSSPGWPISSPAAGQSAVEISETLEPDWEEAFQRSRPNTDPAIVRMILEGALLGPSPPLPDKRR